MTQAQRIQPIGVKVEPTILETRPSFWSRLAEMVCAEQLSPTQAIDYIMTVDEDIPLDEWAAARGVTVASMRGVLRRAVETEGFEVFAYEEPPNRSDESYQTIRSYIEQGLSPAEAIDYHAVVDHDTRVTWWAESRQHTSSKSVRENVHAAKQKLADNQEDT